VTPAEAELVEARAGRPRDPAVDAAILDATADAFVEAGYAGVSIEGVAARAGVGKATIYRRYADKAELVVDAVRCGAQIDDQLVDTGDLRADLRWMMSSLFERLRGDQGPLLLTFAAERIRNPELASTFDRVVVGKKREHIRHLLQAAADRGDLAADADLDLIAEVPAAVLWHHALHGLGFPDDLPDRILDLVLGPVRAT
jgi:AcrR family transcriptional regulator